MHSNLIKETSYLVFELPNNGKLKIATEAVAAMKAYMQVKPDDKEAGGVLLGRLLKSSNDIIVDEVTAPMLGDKRSKYSFFRSKKRHQEVIDLKWKQSSGTTTYLGEWHTHPESIPTPSNIDLTDWRRRLKSDTYAEFLFFLIIGTKEIKCWMGSGNKLYTTSLKRIC